MKVFVVLIKSSECIPIEEYIYNIYDSYEKALKAAKGYIKEIEFNFLKKLKEDQLKDFDFENFGFEEHKNTKFFSAEFDYDSVRINEYELL